MNSFEPVAIVGMACRFPDAPDVRTFWHNLCQAHDSVRSVPENRWPEQTQSYYAGLLDQIDRFDAAFFGIGGSEADAMDPQQRLLMMLSWECFEDAGLVAEHLANQAVGVFIGLSSADYYQSQLQETDQVDMYTITGAATSVCANRISYFYDLRGPSLIVDTACSSSLSAVHLACESLQRGESTLALAGGVNLLLSPLIQQGFADAMSLSPVGRCQAFGAHADGMVRGEGAGMVCLKPLQQALTDGDRIYGVIQGSAMGQDGQTNGLTAPSPAGQRAVLQQAYARSQVQATDVFFVEAHGTGTPLGDPIEAKALADVVGKNAERQAPLLLGSVKSNLGHLEAAAGIAGLIKATLALYHRYLPPTLHADTPNPRIPFKDWGLQINRQGTPLPESLVAGVSAFGFGGTNEHLVLQSAAQQQNLTATQAETQADQEFVLLPLCAKSERALKQTQTALADYLDSEPATQVADIAAHWAWRRQSGLSRALRQGCLVSANVIKAADKAGREDH